jgi:2-polyprenyl-3-methyl-5-hydroxy-6-metoxy-1,4-benzoquinol methylase
MNKITSVNDYKFVAGDEPHTVKFLEPVIFRYIHNHNVRSVLDIGCGNGAIDRDMAELCATVVGMDPSESGIEEAKKNCPKGKFYHLDIYDAPEAISENEFDMVVSTEVVEHIFYPRFLPRFASKKLKKGGIFLLSTPYHGYLKNVAIAALGKWDNHHTVLWDGGHIKFWSRATLAKLLEEEGFELIGFHGCGRIPYLWKSMILVGRKKA